MYYSVKDDLYLAFILLLSLLERKRFLYFPPWFSGVYLNNEGNIIMNEKKLTLKIEDLEERIAPHLNVILPEAASDMANPGAHPKSGLHGTLGPGAGDSWSRPHF